MMAMQPCTYPSSAQDLQSIAQILANSRLAALYQDNTSVEDMRKATAAMLQHPMVRQPLPEVSVSASTLAGVAGEWLNGPADPARGPVLLFFHGGGYVRGSLALGRIDASELAALTGLPVFCVQYRQAPEHPFPAAVDDAVSAYRAMLAQGFPGGRIFLAGESAGGALVFSVALSAREAGLPRPAGLVAISPMVDMSFSGPSWKAPPGSDVVTREMGEQMIALYATAEERLDPLASPLFARFEGLSPTLLQIGGNELLASGVERLAERAVAAGVEVTLKRYEGMPHGFTKFRVDAATAAMRHAAEWVKAEVKDPGCATHAAYLEHEPPRVEIELKLPQD